MRTTRFTLVSLAFCLGAFPAAGQVGASTQINECLVPAAVEGSVELLPCSVRFNAMGEITFSIKNRGTMGVNTPAATVGSAPRRAAQPSGPQIKMDVQMGGKLIESIYQASLAAGARREFTVKIPSNYTTPRCGESRELRIVVDPQNLIQERSEANNALARTEDRPCPDMAIDSIRKNANSAHTEFVAEIRFVNLGNAPAKFRYLAMTSNSMGWGPIPSADFDVPMEIAPGQSKKITVGNAFGYQTMYVRVFVDRFNEVAEMDESNNFKEKTLD